MKTNKIINLNRRKFLKFILVAAGFLGLTKLVGHKLINSTYAWSEPTAVPPGANVPAPINMGTTAQHKNGEIGATRFVDRDNTAWFVDPAGTSVLAGNVGIGTTSPTHRLHVVGTGSIDTLHAPTRLRIPVGTNMFS